MNYSPEQIRMCADAKEALDKGQPIEQLNASYGGKWTPFEPPFALGGGWLYRPKPQPKRVPWSKPEHVPGPVCWIRPKSLPEGCALIIRVGPDTFAALAGSEVRSVGYGELWKYDHSTDRINWHPCEVEESA